MKNRAMMLLCCCAGWTALALPKDDSPATTVKDSVIINENKNVNITAENRSGVNTGIQARGATISNAVITNKFTGNVDARNNSHVTTGVKADGATIKDSSIEVDTKGNITADHATVKTGVDINEARNARIKTTYEGDINAAGATVKAGVVEGEIRRQKITTEVNENIDAAGKGVIIGTVSGGSGQASQYGGKSAIDYSKNTQGGPAARIGNVEVQSGMVREVNTTVGGKSAVDGLKTRHMAKVYEDQGGVDPSGTKHVYVTKAQKEKAKKTGGAVGNTNTADDSRIKKVNTFVE